MTGSSTQESSSSTELLQMVICQLSDEEFGIEIYKVKEIIRIPSITKIPQIPDHVKGVINLRGSIIPIIDLAARFGMVHKDASENSRIVVLEIGDLTAGVIVDSVNEVLNIPGENIEPAPDILVSGIAGKYVQGVGKVDDRLLILLDIDRIFKDEQKLQLSQVENAGAVPA
ncbi:chemotaxis protein CheW [Methanolobus profundi]|uniref:Purine-binding chemotaxis protein CheW n=1 Tax=Methanolobus profundi TaxID=487685 RepID=A0A1I4QMH5_9EURY|nr:chemotaxis protein CheW [Methanolobus profundi]SFM40853.1 purine-binding chemotaxis protein CheW [Methanolobus profundi]